MTDTDDTPTWYVDETASPPFGWTDDGDTFAVYRRGMRWYPITTRRRLWWERYIKTWLAGIGLLAAFFGWATTVGALSGHGHGEWAGIILAAPIAWACGYYYAKSH